jgi:CO/xanthine dehydrogenase Mo-binding subunit
MVEMGSSKKINRSSSQVGKPVVRLDGYAKVTGRTRYTSDLSLPGMIWGKCLRSPFPHARIVGIHTAEARKLKGVVAVITASDMPQRLVGRRLKDMPVLAQGVARFLGERVAAVGAETAEVVEEALSRIRVDYEELKAVYDPPEAMSEGSPILHENLRSYENLRLPLPNIPNVHSHARWLFGNPDKAFDESDFVFEQTFTTQRVHHGYLEPHAVTVAIDSSGKILVWCPAKGPYATRQQLAEWLGIDETRVVFQLSPVGGDFGGKGSLMDIPVCTVLAKVTGRPVKMVMSYFEELTAANPRHPSMITIRSGVKKDGKLWARDVKAIFNSGAYAGLKNNETVNLPGARHGTGAYCIPHVKIDAFSVYTNCVPSGIMRGPGEAQMVFAVESHTDHIAREMGMDPLEFRSLNVLKRGDLLPYGIRLQDDQGQQLLKAITAKLRWNGAKPKKPYVGRGLALCVREIGIGEANVEVGLKGDGNAYILTTVPDTGTGAHTIFRQIVAEVLELSADSIEVVVGTTDSFSTDVVVAASRVTYLAGRAAQRAALELRDLVMGEAARHPVSRVASATQTSPRSGKISFADLAARICSAGKPLAARSNFKMVERTGAACFFAQAAEVKIDPQTGKVKILKMLSAHDVGTVLNPLTHQGQVEGGMVQGLGFGLMENLLDDDGRIVTSNLGEYKIPSISDVPEHETVLVEDQDGPGPFHSKPIGEHGAVPTAPCIANAIYDAIGIQIKELPLDAEKIYAALKMRDNAGASMRRS